MSFAGEIEALFEETLRMLDREAEIELGQIGCWMLFWAERMLQRMPCETWRDEFDDFIVMLAREHVIVAEESYWAWIERLREANEAAEEDARTLGSAEAVRAHMREYFKRPDPPQYRDDKPAPFDPDYPQLRRGGNYIMEHYPLAEWDAYARFWLQSYLVSQEIKDAFVGWLEEERRKVLGIDLSPEAKTAAGPADNPYYAICFAAGTPVLTRRGQIAIESVTTSDEVWAVPECDPLAPARWCRVERAYHNAPAELFEAHVDGGATIRSTLNHKFHVQDRGWVPAIDLRPGDLLRTHDDRWVPVVNTFRTSDIEPVFNLCVGGYHTYFAAGVLVHNESSGAHLPSDDRGTWIEGTKGNGIFQYSNTPRNQARGVAGMKVTYKDGYIGLGAFPAAAYYGGSVAAATVTIPAVQGTNADMKAADQAMRQKLNNPEWKRPKGYSWNHAGKPGSTRMELLETGPHRAVAHEGPASAPRAAARGARAFSVLNVYLLARGIGQATGALQPDYGQEDKTYFFQGDDGSVFFVEMPGWFGLFSSSQRVYASGPRAGQRDDISDEAVLEYKHAAEAVWGRYVPGSLFHEPRFIPGSMRKSIPLWEQDEFGVQWHVGEINENGVQRNALGKKFL